MDNACADNSRPGGHQPSTRPPAAKVSARQAFTSPFQPTEKRNAELLAKQTNQIKQLVDAGDADDRTACTVGTYPYQNGSSWGQKIFF